MLDYYLSCLMAGPGHFNCRDQWNYKLKSMKIGEEFTVETAFERKCILKRARRMGVMVSTAKLRDGSYSIQRIKDTGPRKPGQPAKWGKLNELL